MSMTRDRKAYYLAHKEAIQAKATAWKKANPLRFKEIQARSRQRKRKAIAEIKLERGCTDCGYNIHPAALDFDHVHGEKSVGIGGMGGGGRSWKATLAEIEKCDVVCANCHRVRTVRRLVHG